MFKTNFHNWFLHPPACGSLYLEILDAILTTKPWPPCESQALCLPGKLPITKLRASRAGIPAKCSLRFVFASSS